MLNRAFIRRNSIPWCGMLKIKSIPNVVQQGIRTYDYILTMREERCAEDFLDESDILSTLSSPASSVDSFDDHHKNTNFFSKFSCLSNHQVGIFCVFSSDPPYSNL